MIWGHTANIPKVIAVKRLKFDNEHDVLFDTYLAPVLPFYPQLRVCKEARHEVLKTALHLIHMYPFIIDAPQIFLNPWTDTLWLTTNLEVEFGEDDVDVLSGYYKLTISPSIHCLRVPRLALPWSLQLEEPLKYRIWV